MRRVDYEDHLGRKFASLLPDGEPDFNAHKGIPIGPPDLGPVGLPEAIEVRLNNQLFNRGLLTRDDIRKRPNEVRAALMAALQVDAQVILGLFTPAPELSGDR